MNSKKEIIELFEKFNQLTALIIGDVMIDGYVWGKVERISPEAPVPVVQVTRKEDRLGGAANVAKNVRELGAKPIVCAVVGDDEKGQKLKQLLKDQEMDPAGIISSSERPTTVKTRIISSPQQIARIDEESTAPLSITEENSLIDRISELLSSQKIDVIIFEDYNKGVLTPRVIEKVISLAEKKNIPTTVDPKKDNFFAYKKATLFKPNLKELREGLKIEFDKRDVKALQNAESEMRNQLQNSISLITLSELGVFYSAAGDTGIIPAHPRDITDVSGAGDTVISVASLCLALGTEVAFLAALSNLAGGLVCERVGVVPVDRELLLQEALRLPNLL